MKTAEKIKALRLQKGMTQEELGRAVGVQRAAINKYEKGSVVNIKRSVLQGLADALGCAPVDLLDDEDSLFLDSDGGIYGASQISRSEQKQRLLYYINMMDAVQMKTLVGVARALCGEEE